MSNTQSHQKIVEYFKNGKYFTLKELSKNLKISENTVAVALEDLVVSDVCGFLNNYKNKKREKLYYLKDLFCLSYNKFVKDKILTINNFNNQSFFVNFGFVFETICLNNIDLIKDEIKRSGFSSIEYSWHNKESQIDLIIEYNKNHYSIVECKFYKDNFELTEDYQKNLLNKKDEFEKFLGSKKINKPIIDFIIVSLNNVKIKNKKLGFISNEVIFSEIVGRLL